MGKLSDFENFDLCSRNFELPKNLANFPGLPVRTYLRLETSLWNLKGRAQTTRQPRRGIRSRKNLEVGNKNFTRLKFDFAQLLKKKFEIFKKS